jgi:dienelactone hydrolase
MLGRRFLQGTLAVTALIAACSGGPSVAVTSGSGGSGGLSTGAPTGGTSAGGASTGGAPAGGAAPDASSTSAGGAATDAGADAGPMDAGEPDATDAEAGAPPVVSAPAIACTDSLADVYVTPTGLPPMTPATRGDIIRCAPDAPLTLSVVMSEVAAQGITTAMKTAVNLFRIEFRTERGDGSPGASSARVYLPVTPLELPLPVIVIGHPTDGLAASCTPSQDPTSNEDLALPWAGLGFAVIVPDYAGLGTEGVQAYLDNHDQAYSVLDGARALRKLLPAGAFSQQVLAVGFSQGGGAVLSAQALAPSYGVDGTLAGVIAFAPEWPTRLNSFGYVDELENPTELTILTGLSEDVVAVMRSYAYFYNNVGPTDVGDGFPAANQAGMDNAVETLCQTPLGGYLQAAEPVVGDIFDPTFRETLLACIGGADAGVDAGCTDPGLSFYTFLNDNFVTADPSGPPVLFVQGLDDYIMPPASEAACNIAKLQADGVTPQVCTDAAAQHQTVVARNMDFAIPWALALLAGQPLPTCSSAGMPACTP